MILMIVPKGWAMTTARPSTTFIGGAMQVTHFAQLWLASKTCSTALDKSNHQIPAAPAATYLPFLTKLAASAAGEKGDCRYPTLATMRELLDRRLGRTPAPVEMPSPPFEAMINVAAEVCDAELRNQDGVDGVMWDVRNLNADPEVSPSQVF